VTRVDRLRRIRRVARAQDYFASRPDPASLAREPTRAERDQIARESDQAGARAGAAWVARQRGIR
jgi:hypothetical protein